VIRQGAGSLVDAIAQNLSIHIRARTRDARRHRFFPEAAFMQNEHAAINRRLSDPDFQASLLSRAIGLALGTSLLASVLVVHDAYVWTHPPTPKYFVIDGRKAREITALDTPIVDDAQLLDWSTRAALAPYNINYNDYPQQLSEPPRDCRRPQLLRGWGYGSEEEDIEQIFS
jgi:hypothetical protein